MTTATAPESRAKVAPTIVSPLLRAAGFRHGFFTRRGGTSQGPFASLNTSFSTGDDPVRVSANLEIAAATLGVRRDRLFVATQVHGKSVRLVDGNDSAADVAREEHDAIASGLTATACAVRVADCVPVLLADRATGMVAAVHSGWQGTEKNVVARAIVVLREHGGAGDLVAAIGPHIETCCFEVGNDIAARLAACSTARAVIVASDTGGPHVDLRRIVRAEIVAAGVNDENIDDVRGCTRCDATQFYSFRRDGAESGRLIAAIRAGR